MPALDFPSSPTLGQVFSGANKSWTWDGDKWIITQYDNGVGSTVGENVVELIENEGRKAFALAFVLS